jgi:hypothetical protein
MKHSFILISFLFAFSSAIAEEPIALSYLVPNGSHCDLVKIDLQSNQAVTLAEMPGDCTGARMSWSYDLQKAVVWFDPILRQEGWWDWPHWPKYKYPPESYKGCRERIFKVDIPNKTVGAVTLLPGDPVSFDQKEIGFTRNGELIGLTLTGDIKTKDGLTAQAFRWRKGKWLVFDQHPVVETDIYGNGGINSLKGFDQLGPRSLGMLCGDLDSGYVEDSETLKRLKKEEPPGLDPDTDHFWYKVKSDYGAIYVLTYNMRETFGTGFIRLDRGGKLIPLSDLGFMLGDSTAMNVKGPYLLVASVWGGCHPRVYDLRTGGLVFKSDIARATVFWPEAEKGQGQK